MVKELPAVPRRWKLAFQGIQDARIALYLIGLFFTILTAYRAQSSITEHYIPDGFDSPTTTKSNDTSNALNPWGELVPPPPHLVLNTTFFQLPEHERQLTRLRHVDREQYTLRILSWKRAQFLAASVALHSQCPGIKQIQVVWSILQEDNITSATGDMPDNRLPREVLDNPKVVVERRQTNRLNNRFDVLSTTPTTTLGIVIIDDDLIYTCEALDMGFFLWTQHPDRMVTYAPRRHIVTNAMSQPPQWRYGWHRKQEYSLGLTSTAFLHRDYLHYYTHYLPRDIYKHVQDHMNCEDIAMSLLISNLTRAQMPIAVDEWGFTSRLQLALPTGYEGIKAGKNHMPHRSGCVNWFATDLQLKDKFHKYATFWSVSTFNTAAYDNSSQALQQILANPRFQALEEKRREWKQLANKDMRQFGRVVTGIRRSLDDYAKSRNLSSEGHG